MDISRTLSDLYIQERNEKANVSSKGKQYLLFKDNLNFEKNLINVLKFYYSKIIKYRTGSQEKIRKRHLFKKVQAFCEEKVLRYLIEVFWYAESKNQCWQAEKWRLCYLICIFPRWPPN